MKRLILGVTIILLGCFISCSDDPSKEGLLKHGKEVIPDIDRVGTYALNMDTWKVQKGHPEDKGRYWLGMIKDGQAFVDTNGNGFFKVNLPLAKPAQNTDEVRILGDTNLDGTVNQSDVFVFFLMLITESQDLPLQANINRDPTTDWTDLALLGAYVFGGPNAENPHNIGQPIPTTDPGPQPPGPPPDDDRDGSSLERAIIVDPNSSTNGDLTANEMVYYRVDIDSPGTLTAYTTGGLDTYGYLLDDQGAILEQNDDSTTPPSLNFRVSSSLQPGTYHVRVRGFSAATTGSYVLHVEFQPGGQPSEAGFRDDFNSSASLENWTIRNATAAVTNGVLELTSTSSTLIGIAERNVSPAITAWTLETRMGRKQTTNSLVNLRWRTSHTRYPWVDFVIGTLGDYNYSLWAFDSEDGQWKRFSATGLSGNSTAINDGAGELTTISLSFVNGRFRGVAGNTELFSFEYTSEQRSYHILTHVLSVGLVSEAAVTGRTVMFDWIDVDGEPVAVSFTPELASDASEIVAPKVLSTGSLDLSGAP